MAGSTNASPLARLDLPIEGMTCAACATRIGKGLSKIDGVAQADVNLAAARATVHFDPAVTSRAEFAEKIESLGYHGPEVDRRDEAEAEYAHTLGIRLLVAVVKRQIKPL